MGKLKKEAEGKINAGGKVAKKNVGEVKPGSKKEIKRLANQKVKYEGFAADKIVNLEMEKANKRKKEERIAEGKLVEEGKACVWKPKSKSLLETERIIREGAEMGKVISVEVVRMIKKEMRIQATILHPARAVHYFRTLESRVGKAGMQIILLSTVIYIIQAKCPMPSDNAKAYQAKSVLLAAAQTANLQSYFTPAFPGLA